MKRLLLPALLLGTVSVARAQISAPLVTIDRGNVAQEFSATSAAKATILSDLASADTFSSVAAKSSNTFASPVVATALAVATTGDANVLDDFAATEEKVSAEAMSLRIVAFAAEVAENSWATFPRSIVTRGALICARATLTVPSSNAGSNSLFMSLPSEG